MVMSPLDQRECIMIPSGSIPSLNAPTLAAAVQRTVMVSEALIERIIEVVLWYSLTGVSAGHNLSHMCSKMFTPDLTG